MSVRMAVAKLCACACGGAVIGGGAVHVAERPAHVQYAKVRQIKPVRRVALHRPNAVRRPRGAPGAVNCAPPGTATAFAARAAPPYLSDPSVAAGDPGVNVGSAGGPAVSTGGGGFYGGGSGGGRYYTTAAHIPGGSSGGTGSVTTGGGGTSAADDPRWTGDGATSTGTQGGSTGLSNGGGGSVTTATGEGDDPKSKVTPSGTGTLPPPDPADPTPVPAPPMLLLFGAAAAALIVRRQIGRRKRPD